MTYISNLKALWKLLMWQTSPYGTIRSFSRSGVVGGRTCAQVKVSVFPSISMLWYSNGDTRRELLIRSRYLLFKSADKWTERQKQRAAILFEEYPDIKKAYGLCHSLRRIFSKNTIKDAARLAMARWYNKVEDAGMHSFNVIAAAFYEHYDEILNFYNHRSSNAMAESFNAKIKLFRANLRGVADKKFFLFRIAKLYAYPH